MTDPIRDALEAAWRAMTVDPDDAPDGVIQHQRAAAAAAVAGFLRALPDESGLNIAAPDTRDDWFGCDELATIIEHVTKGEA